MKNNWIHISAIKFAAKNLDHKKVREYLEKWKGHLGPHTVCMHHGEMVAPSTPEYLWAAQRFGICVLKVEEK